MDFEWKMEARESGAPREDDRLPGNSAGSRRAFLKSLAAVGAGALLPAGAMLGQVTGRSAGGEKNGRIDVHNHFTPPALLAAVGEKRLGAAMAKWTPDKTLADMDAAGVTTVLTSIAPQGDPFGDPATAVRLAHDCNEYAARMATDHPGRFGVFAMTPMPNIDASLREIEYAYDTLKADGIGLFTSYGDKWLGDPAFDPVFEELNRRKAVVYTHPQSANCCKNLLASVNDGAIEWGTDTTRRDCADDFWRRGGTIPQCEDDFFAWRRHDALSGGTVYEHGEIAATRAEISQRVCRRGRKVLLRHRTGVEPGRHVGAQ